MRLVRRIVRAYYAARAHQQFADSEYQAALQSLEAMHLISDLSPSERFWSYYPLVLNEDFDLAFAMLDDICRDTEHAHDGESRLINLCARAARASNHGDVPLQKELLRQAKLVKTKLVVRRWAMLD